MKNERKIDRFFKRALMVLALVALASCGGVGGTGGGGLPLLSGPQGEEGGNFLQGGGTGPDGDLSDNQLSEDGDPNTQLISNPDPVGLPITIAKLTPDTSLLDVHVEPPQNDGDKGTVEIRGKKNSIPKGGKQVVFNFERKELAIDVNEDGSFDAVSIVLNNVYSIIVVTVSDGIHEGQPVYFNYNENGTGTWTQTLGTQTITSEANMFPESFLNDIGNTRLGNEVGQVSNNPADDTRVAQDDRDIYSNEADQAVLADPAERGVQVNNDIGFAMAPNPQSQNVGAQIAVGGVRQMGAGPAGSIQEELGGMFP